jgi:cytochrome c oxidase subunit 2
MKIDLYEKIWMWGVGVVLAAFFATTAISAIGGAVHPPSHVETIDPTTVLTDPRFRRQGISVDESGRIHARVVGLTFAWLPREMTVPAATPVTFHITSTDVTHGFQIIRTNGQSMVIPGYVSQFTTQFDEPGEYVVVCNEYCGVGHHTMAGRLHVVPPAAWREPSASASAISAGGSHASH